MVNLQQIREGGLDSYEWFYFIALALILAFGTIQTTGSALDTERPVVSVISCSMYPVYNVGDILVVQGQDYEDIETGDIVIYEVPDRAEFELNGRNYILEKDSPDFNESISTEVGEVKLIDVRTDLSTNRGVALMEIDGEKFSVGEGSNTNGIEVKEVSGQPVPIVHRVIKKNEDHLETKGDANSQQLDFESNVRPFQIYGTTAFKIPRIGAVKLIFMDLVGYNSDKPLVIDNLRTCRS